MMLSTIASATAALVLSVAVASAAPIEGVWKTESGERAQMYACGETLCVKLLTGTHKNAMLSRDLKDEGDGRYAGSLFNPADGKTYSGAASLAGNDTLKLKGCALKIFCKTQTWTRLK